MEKKITIKDIAKQADVSIATVSYVINDRRDKRISEETRKKVLQFINLLNYTPNSSAQSLATKKTWNIVLYIPENASYFNRGEHSLITEALSKELLLHNYHLILQPCNEYRNINYADAILCYDASNDYFLQIGDNNNLPLIAIDTGINIPLFYQVCTDYNRIKKCATEHYSNDSFTYLCPYPNNSNVETLIRNTFEHVIMIHDYSDLPSDLDCNIVYSCASLTSLFQNNPKAFYVPINLEDKVKKIYQCIELAMNRIPNMEHRLYV